MAEFLKILKCYPLLADERFEFEWAAIQPQSPLTPEANQSDMLAVATNH
jgi:hypothetical protein